MISAVDTNVVLDIFLRDPVFSFRSLEAIAKYSMVGRIVVCDVVWAELAAVAPATRSVEDMLAPVGIEFDQMDKSSATMAGSYWRQYRESGGTRNRVLADFLIAAHASLRADQLITRDRGFFRQHFSGLRIIDPTEDI